MMDFINFCHDLISDQSDIDLRDCLANLTAMVMGCSKGSKNVHLWYHMFAPEKLVGTYMSGFMVRASVHALVYDCNCC